MCLFVVKVIVFFQLLNFIILLMFAKHSSFINTSRNVMSYGKSFIQLASISFVREYVNMDSSLKLMDLQGNISPQSYSSVIA